jgi:hypothetical protein
MNDGKLGALTVSTGSSQTYPRPGFSSSADAASLALGRGHPALVLSCFPSPMMAAHKVVAYRGRHIDRTARNLSVCPMLLLSRAVPEGFIAPCLPTSARPRLPATCGCTKSSTTAFRVIARKEGERVRLNHSSFS